jgi:type IV secretory pathway VirB4 component
MKNRSRLFKDFNEYQHEHSLSKELPYWEFIDNMAVLSDGSLCAGFTLKGLAIETWDADRINRLTVDLRSMLNGLNDGCEVTFAVEMNSDFSKIVSEHEKLKGDEPNIRWVAESRIGSLKAQVESESLLKSNLYLFIYQRIGHLAEGKKPSLIKSFFSSAKTFETIRLEQFEKMKKDLGQTSQAICDSLLALGVETAAMKGTDLWDLIYRFFNPKRAKAVGAPVMQKAHANQEFSTEELKIVPELVLPSPREQLVFSDLIQGYENFFYDCKNGAASVSLLA